MWSNAFRFIVDLYKEAKSSSDERCNYATTVTRLRQSPRTQTFWTDNKSAQQEQTTSLFGAVRPGYAAHLPERRAVGHWFKMTVPNERDKRLKLAVRSYEADFRPGLGMQDSNFDQYLTSSAKKKALEHYIISSQTKQVATNAATRSDRFAFSAAVVGSTNEDAEASGTFTTNTTPIEPDELLIRQSQDENESVRGSVAGNEQAPIAVFWLLSEDSSRDVKLTLIANAKCPLAILDKLTRDFDGRVSRKAQLKLRAILSQDVGIASGNLSVDNVDWQEEFECEPEALAMQA